jgi:predicted HNH restriction endonuclease
MLRWLTKPDSDPTKYKRPTQHLNLVADICEMCMRTLNEFPKGTTLEAHHVMEFKDDGSNARENIWIICTACHRMIHWIRTYHGTITLRNQVTEQSLFTK